MVDGERGLLVEPGRPQELAVAFKRLLADPAWGRRMGEPIGRWLAETGNRRIIEVDPKGKVVNQWRTGSRTIASIDLVR